MVVPCLGACRKRLEHSSFPGEPQPEGPDHWNRKREREEKEQLGGYPWCPETIRGPLKS